jgi:nucleotide-binding universal stress UspA family protein
MLAKACGSRLVLLQIVDVAGARWDVPGVTLTEQREYVFRQATEYLDAMKSDLAASGIEVVTVALKTVPVGASIVDYALNNDIDLIAMATHGRSGMGRMMMGSIAEYVMKESSLPMLLIKVG